jgi:hypothetical protein
MKLLGKVVEDRVSKLRGIAINYVETHAGSRQYAVQPPGDGKNLPDAFQIDVQQLDLVPGEDGVRAGAYDEELWNKIPLGSPVVHRMSDLEGRTVARVRFLNGCVYMMVQPRVTLKGHLPDLQSIPALDLEVRPEDEVAAPTSPPSTRRPPGGPTTRVQRPTWSR